MLGDREKAAASDLKQPGTSFSSSCSSEVLFPADIESFHKMACIVNCAIFLDLTRVTQSSVNQQLLDSHVFLNFVKLVHPSPNSLTIEGICQYTPSAHFVQVCQGWKHSTTTIDLLLNSCYHLLQNSYGYVTCGVNAFNKSVRLHTELTNLWLVMSFLKYFYLHSDVLTVQNSCTPC